jgi:hypothetical protein
MLKTPAKPGFRERLPNDHCEACRDHAPSSMTKPDPAPERSRDAARRAAAAAVALCARTSESASVIMWER